MPITEDAPLSATNPYGQTKLMGEQILRDLGASDADLADRQCCATSTPWARTRAAAIGEDPRGMPNNLMPFVAQVAVGRRPNGSAGVRQRLPHAPMAPACATTSTSEDLAEGHVAALRRLLGRAGLASPSTWARARGYSVLDVIAGLCREPAAARCPMPDGTRGRPGDVAASVYADPALAQASCWAGRPMHGLQRMCEDSWRWQSQNPQGYPKHDTSPPHPLRRRPHGPADAFGPPGGAAMTLLVQPVVMAGGSGTRLWPLSRAGFPKQFLVLSGTTSLFQQAVVAAAAAWRTGGLHGAEPPLVVGNEEHRFMVLDQMREARIEPGAVLLEPMGRNTAPAMMLAALQALDAARATHGEDADPVLVVTAADQTIADGAAFTAAMRRAVVQAAEGAIVILGITPDRPETGYGYIRAEPAPGSAGAAGQHCADGGPVRREARPCHRREVPRRRQLLLERQHLRVARVGVGRGARAFPP